MEDNYDLKNLRKKPKRKNSRAKGHGFERDIAKLLNNRFNTTEFSRTPGSGAFATTHSLPAHLKIYGDLITPYKFRYCIECKKGYNNINLYSLYNNSSEVWDFLRQTQKDSQKCGRIPMMILKQDRKPALAFIPQYEAETPRKIDIHGLSYMSIIYKKDKYAGGEKWNIYKFADLLGLEDSKWFGGEEDSGGYYEGGVIESLDPNKRGSY